MRSAAIYVGPDFVGDRWQHFRLQLRLNVVNLEYLTIYICGADHASSQLELSILWRISRREANEITRQEPDL